MDVMEDKLNSILSNPEIMSQLMTMAQSLGNQAPEPPRQEPSPPSPPPQKSQPSNNFDMAMVHKIAGIMQQTGIDRNQTALLRALSPYLSPDRISKLEKAMRAAKIAGVAATVMGSGGLFSGR